MTYLGQRGRLWLKAIHVFSACIWTGTVLCLLTLSVAQRVPQSPDELSGYFTAVTILETVLIPLGAGGCVLTGLGFSCLTKWGFVTFWWILVKWVGTITVMITGASFGGRLLHLSRELLARDGLAVLHNSTFLSYQTIMAILKPTNAIILSFLFFLSYVKPWGVRTSKKMR